MEPTHPPLTWEQLESLPPKPVQPNHGVGQVIMDHLRGFTAFSWFMITRFIYLTLMAASLVIGAIGSIISLGMLVGYLLGANGADFSGTPISVGALFLGLALLYYACMRNPVTLRKLLDLFRL